MYIFQYTHLAKFTMVAKCVYFPIYTLSEIYHGWWIIISENIPPGSLYWKHHYIKFNGKYLAYELNHFIISIWGGGGERNSWVSIYLLFGSTNIWILHVAPYQNNSNGFCLNGFVFYIFNDNFELWCRYCNISLAFIFS